jgi:hypothetical protein
MPVANKMTKRYTTLLFAGLLTGTLDILAAIVNFLAHGGQQISRIFQYIASSVFGKPAFTGGDSMILMGIVIHYLIAFVFTVLFFFLYPRLSILSRNKWIGAIVYGIFIWVVMNLVLVPLTKARKLPMPPDQILIGAAILILMIGLPLSFIANRYYRGRR